MAKSKKPITRILIMNELGYPVCVTARYKPETQFFLITIMEDTVSNQAKRGAKTILPGYNFTIECRPTDHYQVASSLKGVFKSTRQVNTILFGPDKGLRAHCYIMSPPPN